MEKKKILWVTVIAFILLAVLYFLPVRIPLKLCFPLAVLLIASFSLQSWVIIVAMLCCLAGDLSGQLHQFVPQMGFFAVAHLFFIGYFLSLGLKRKRAKEDPVKGWYFALATLFAVGLFYLAAEKIIPYAPEGVVRTGMYVYAGLIAVMMWSALMQRDVGHRRRSLRRFRHDPCFQQVRFTGAGFGIPDHGDILCRPVADFCPCRHGEAGLEASHFFLTIL